VLSFAELFFTLDLAFNIITAKYWRNEAAVLCCPAPVLHYTVVLAHA
jgi:hypothetical protein